MSNHRNLPSIEKILSSNIIQKVISGFGKARVKNRIRSMQAHLRSQKSIPDWATSPEKYALQIESDLSLSAYLRVVYLTGTVIHTNLGRSPLASEILRAIEPLLTNPMSFEYDSTRLFKRKKLLKNEFGFKIQELVVKKTFLG